MRFPKWRHVRARSINSESDCGELTSIGHGSSLAIRVVVAFIICVGALIAGLSGTSQIAAAQGAKSNFKLAYIPCGRVNDQSWSQAGYEGVLAAQKELGIEVAYSESVPPADVEAGRSPDLLSARSSTFHLLT